MKRKKQFLFLFKYFLFYFLIFKVFEKSNFVFAEEKKENLTKITSQKEVLKKENSYELRLSSTGGNIHFLALGKPGFLKIKGESESYPKGEVRVFNKKISGNFKFDLATLKTGIELRDDHMKNTYLEVSSYPEAQFTFDEQELVLDPLKESFKKTLNGSLTLHGVTQKVNCDLDYSSSDQTAKIKFQILISSYQIKVPEYLGVKVADSVDVEVFLKLKKE